VAALLLVLVFRWEGRQGLVRWAPLVIALPLAVSLAVVRMRWHYATDAIGGIALGAAVVFGEAVVLYVVASRLRRALPADAETS
jgi:hypothetical protein